MLLTPVDLQLDVSREDLALMGTVKDQLRAMASRYVATIMEGEVLLGES